MTVELTYNVLEQVLTGSIDGTVVHARAVSGGRAGSKTEGAVNPLLANNPYLSGVKLSNKTSGGTLPLGRYKLTLHEKKKDWIRLTPVKAYMKDRDGFAIHGRGPRGSDGCIVPMDFYNVLLLCKLCELRADAGGSPPLLDVVAIGDADEPIRRMATWLSIA